MLSKDPTLSRESEHKIHSLRISELGGARVLQFHRFTSRFERLIEVSQVARGQRSNVEEARAVMRSTKQKGEIAAAAAEPESFVVFLFEHILMRHPCIGEQYRCRFTFIALSGVEFIEPLCRFPSERQGFIMAAALPRNRHSISRDLSGFQNSRPIRWLRFEHGLSEFLCDPEVSFGLVHLSEIGPVGNALDTCYLLVSIANLQGKFGISPDVGSQPPQVLQRRVHDQLPGFSASG